MAHPPTRIPRPDDPDPLQRPAGWRRHEGALLGGVLLLVLLALLPNLAPAAVDASGVQLIHGRITALAEPDPDTGARPATVLILDGPRGGESMAADLEVASATFVAPFEVGDEVVVQVSSTPEGDHAAITDRWRGPLIFALLGAFGLLVVLIGGWRGVRALLALALTVGMVVKVVLPLLLAGWPAIPLAIGAATGITVFTLLLTEGFRRSTLAAAIGTLGALLATAALAWIVGEVARFSLLQGSEETAYLRDLIGAPIDLAGLLLAAVILGALGVLDDVTITQAATVAELAAADPIASRTTLFKRAMNVGRSHIAATINTLVLAYVAASLPLLLLFAVGQQPPMLLASTELVAIEIVRTMIGSIGIVLAVPFTTAVAAWLLEVEL